VRLARHDLDPGDGAERPGERPCAREVRGEPKPLDDIIVIICISLIIIITITIIINIINIINISIIAGTGFSSARRREHPHRGRDEHRVHGKQVPAEPPEPEPRGVAVGARAREDGAGQRRPDAFVKRDVARVKERRERARGAAEPRAGLPEPRAVAVDRDARGAEGPHKVRDLAEPARGELAAGLADRNLDDRDGAVVGGFLVWFGFLRVLSMHIFCTHWSAGAVVQCGLANVKTHVSSGATCAIAARASATLMGSWNSPTLTTRRWCRRSAEPCSCSSRCDDGASRIVPFVSVAESRGTAFRLPIG
jgi:hypothetical protein